MSKGGSVKQAKRAAKFVSEVSDKLVAVQEERRLGGLVAEKDDNELFFIDTGKEAKQSGSDVQMVRRLPKFTLKIDEILKPKSAIGARQRTASTSGQQKASRAEEMLVGKRARSLATASSIMVSKSGKHDKKPQVYNVWSDEEEAEPRIRVSKTPKTLPPLSNALSYNPTPEAHLKHLQGLEAAELARLRREEATREQAPMLSVPLEQGLDCVEEANRALLMTLENPVTSEEKEEEGDFSASDSKFTFACSKPKTQRDRNRQRRIRHEQSLLALAAAQRKLDKSIERVPHILAELNAEAASEVLKGEEERLLALEHKRLQRIKKRLPLETLAVKLPEELPSSMRLLSAEGNLVSDRFRSFVERGIVEPSRGLAPAANDSHIRKRLKGTSRVLRKYW
jgi:hypothetical protein